MPVVRRASISSFTCMVPICAANAAPARPAMMMPVMRAPISTAIPMPTRFATKIWAPKAESWMAPTKARIIPVRKLMSETIGSARCPQSASAVIRSAQRKRACPTNRRANASVTSPTNVAASRIPADTDRALRPTRANQPSSVPPVASVRGGTAFASRCRRRTPSGRPDASTATPVRFASANTCSRKTSSELSQRVSPAASNRTCFGRGSADSRRKRSEGSGRPAAVVHGPASTRVNAAASSCSSREREPAPAGRAERGPLREAAIDGASGIQSSAPKRRAMEGRPIEPACASASHPTITQEARSGHT